MNKKYYYSIWVNFIFLPFGLLLLVFGLDQLFLQIGIFDFIINNTDTISGRNSKLGFAIAIFLGFLTTSGSIINILRGKNYVLETNEKGLIVHTGSLDSDFKTIFINWNNFIKAKVDTRLGAFPMATSTGAGRVKVLIIEIQPDTINWPKINLTKNRVSFEKTDSCDKIIIDAWLNKNKYKIAEEINNFTNNQTY